MWKQRDGSKFARPTSKINKRLSIALKKRKAKDQEYINSVLFHARHHATAVAAIVLSGQPKIDEPLRMAWNRALLHYRIKFDPAGGLDYQVRVAEQLGPVITRGKVSSARFTEIFAAAPIWLLQFTRLLMDARWLKFRLPDMASRLTWGSAGFEEVQDWPLLPSGTMTAGDPIPIIDGRQVWLAYACILTGGGDPIQAFKDRHSFDEEEEKRFRDRYPLLAEMNWAMDLDNRKPEEEWSPYEKRRMRKLRERISRFPKQSHK